MTPKLIYDNLVSSVFFISVKNSFFSLLFEILYCALVCILNERKYVRTFYVVYEVWMRGREKRNERRGGDYIRNYTKLFAHRVSVLYLL